ncbi:MAG: 23S rRNA (guanosine(2251)-2'-O)-methyltransferase RlmB, partial [Clostridia bacterium]|nr:23S rRNA (guanosine(2251)-2'-O)-methyltransferase RlmB [Clostridia bacterium]
MLIYGKNSVLEALKSEKTFNRLFIDKGAKDKTLQEIINLARENGVKVDFVDRFILENKLRDAETGQKINYQGVVGEVVEFEYSELEDVFKIAEENGIPPFILMLDGIEDPHNLGAIIRTAECAGVHGVIIPDRRACLVNETVIKTSSGAVANVKIVKVTNLNNTIRELKDKGVWVYACEIGGKDLFKTKLTGPIAIVVGSEGNGISRLVKENCDDIVTIPMKGKINSLNVS